MFDRERFLRGAAYGVFAFVVGGAQTLLTCAEARAANVTPDVLTSDECSRIETFGETLLPGARDAGIAHFIDQQLRVEPEDCLLMLRYLGYHESFTQFYRGGLAALDASSRQTYGGSFSQLPDERRSALVQTMISANPPGWEGVPAPLFYLAVRSDAVDVVYGTVAGFERLAIPYMPHIRPQTPW